MAIPKFRLNLIELLAGAVLVGVLAYTSGQWSLARRLQPYVSKATPEVTALEKRCGPDRNSRYVEEWVIRDFFNDERGGVFADIGANHYQRDNNTYFLETSLGWSGVAVEPQAKFGADYVTHRPRTRFVPLFVSDVSDQTARLFVPANDLVASSSKMFVDREAGAAAERDSVDVKTTTLDDVLTRSGLTKLDFISIDVELHEPEVLRGFSIDKWRPRLVCIEAQREVRQFELDYFRRHGYVLLGKYVRADAENFWFAPADDTPSEP